MKRCALTAAWACIVVAIGACAQETASAPASMPASAPAIVFAPPEVGQALLKQLASESYPERKAASKRLIELGIGGVKILIEGARSSDPDVRQTCRALFADLQVGLGKRLDQAAEALANDKPEQAKGILEQIVLVEGGPYIKVAWLQLATAYEQLGQRDQMLAALRNAQKSQIEFGEADWSSTRVYQARPEQWDASAAVRLLRDYTDHREWDKALSVEGPNARNRHVEVAVAADRLKALYRLGRYYDVMAEAAPCIRDYEGFRPGVAVWLARAAAELGRQEEAVDPRIRVEGSGAPAAFWNACEQLAEVHRTKGPVEAWKTYQGLRSASLRYALADMVAEMATEDPARTVAVLLQSLEGEDWAAAAAALAEIGVAEAAPKVMARARKVATLTNDQAILYSQALAKFGTDATWAELAAVGAAKPGQAKVVARIKQNYPRATWRELAVQRAEAWKKLQANPPAEPKYPRAHATTATAKPIVPQKIEWNTSGPKQLRGA